GRASASAPRPSCPPPPSGTVPLFGHVVLVVEENHSYSEVIGNSAMPYLNSLASQYGLATQYFANTHPSIGNYFMLTTGQLVTNDDSYPYAKHHNPFSYFTDVVNSSAEVQNLVSLSQ